MGLLGLWSLSTLSLHLGTALSEEVLGPWASKFTQEPALTSLGKLLNFVPILTATLLIPSVGRRNQQPEFRGLSANALPSIVSEL